MATKNRTALRSLGDTLRIILFAALIALTIRTLIFEPFNIPSGSMVPSLLVGDYVLVSKFSYGYSRYTFFGLDIMLEGGRILGEGPERGDIAVFKLPRDTSMDYIKRVIGLPGDRVRLEGGVLFINGEEVRREFLGNILYTEEGRGWRYRQFTETLPNGRSYTIFETLSRVRVDDTPEYVVPEGHYFMMGDNRHNSLDSRSLQVGYVPLENFVGRAELVWFSVEDNMSIVRFLSWIVSIRFDRLFTWL